MPDFSVILKHPAIQKVFRDQMEETLANGLSFAVFLCGDVAKVPNRRLGLIQLAMSYGTSIGAWVGPHGGANSRTIFCALRRTGVVGRRQAWFSRADLAAAASLLLDGAE